MKRAYKILHRSRLLKKVRVPYYTEKNKQL